LFSKHKCLPTTLRNLVNMLYVRVYHFGGDTKGFSEFSSHSQVANMYLKKTIYTKILLNETKTTGV
jgi:hypothetical protein